MDYPDQTIETFAAWRLAQEPDKWQGKTLWPEWVAQDLPAFLKGNSGSKRSSEAHPTYRPDWDPAEPRQEF